MMMLNKPIQKLSTGPLLRAIVGAGVGAARNVSSTNTSPASSARHPPPLRTKKHGIDILHDPLWNKSLAFDYYARDRLGIRGLIPPAVRTLEDQVQRVITHLRELPNDELKNLYLEDIHNRNETVFHRVLLENIDELGPLVYSPAEGVCRNFGNSFTRSRGMYITTKDRGNFSTMVYNWPIDDVHVIVVTDGSRILTLGDIGVHGMAVPIGKLALYVAAGGIAPHRVLPITLDVGTNNVDLLNDPDYMGVRHRRIEGDDYYEFVDEFMQAIYNRWPQAVVQFEDFEASKAVAILNKYRYDYRCFNDDIQGTGCVALAGLAAASRAAGTPMKQQRILCAGAGSGGLSMCEHIASGMEEEGLSRSEAMSSFVVFTSLGALGAPDGKYGNPNHHRGLDDEKKQWINPAVSDGASMMEVMKTFKPTCLLGSSSVGGIFDKDLICQMASQCENPIIMPLSKPKSRTECTPEQAYKWTNGRAIVATGSPFPPYQMPDGSRTLYPSQCNNMYVFPGIGLAASVAGIKRITDRMIYKAATACADMLTEAEKAEGRTFPTIQNIREVSLNVACAVIKEGLEKDLCTKISHDHVRREGLQNYVRRKMYYPEYVPLL